MQLRLPTDRSGRKPYQSDVSEDAWAFVAPYLTLMCEDASQRDHSLREVFNALRYLVRVGESWRYLPNGLPPWYTIDQQTQRWIKVGVFEAMVHDLRTVLRLAAVDAKDGAGRGPKRLGRGGVRGSGLHRRRPGGRGAGRGHHARGGGAARGEAWRLAAAAPLGRRGSISWMRRFRRLAKEHERLPETIAGLHVLAVAWLLLSRTVKRFAIGA